MKTLHLSILLILLTFSLSAQKVGLVLSGGGAKGLAHIGVIKVLEDHNIPIDYIAGTSIGAIIGGLYASGMTTDEMLVLFSSDDFKLWSTGKMDKDDLYYFKRNDEHPDWIKLDVTNEDRIKLVLPINLIPEGQMDFAFMQLTAQTTAACNGNFDQLFVPFRCVATDIYKNEAVIFNSGDLGEAIRASMTFPLVFKPIERDGRFLFDGGMVNNFPTDIMKQDFNPDIIIGHKVTDMGDRPDATDLISQIETMVTQITNYKIPDSLGILMETKLDDVGLLDFPKINYAYSRGVETALLFIDSLENVIQRRVPSEDVQNKRKEFIQKKPEMKFNNIQVEGVEDNSQRKYIIQSVKSKEQIIDIKQLRQSYFNLISDKHIKSINPIAYYNKKTGLYDLRLKVEPRKPFDVEFGGHISTRSNTFGFIEANYKAFKNVSYTLTSNIYFGRFYNSFLLGGRIDNPTRAPFYISGYYTFNLLDYFATSTDLIFTDIKPTYITQMERNFKLEVGYPYTKTGLIDIGISRSTSTDQYYQTQIFNKGDELDQTQFKAFSAYLQIDKKNYDFKQFPTEGSRKCFMFRYVGGAEEFKPGTTAPVKLKSTADHRYFQFKGYYDNYYKINKNISLGHMAEVSFNNKKLFSNYTSSIISANDFSPTPNSLSIFNDHYRANQYMATGGKFIYKINDIFHFRTEIYGFFPVQPIVAAENNTAAYADKIFSKAYLMAHSSVVAQTMIGPLSFEVNYYDKPGQRWFFSVNMGYMLFNQRGF